jgi:hypothetical protein
MAQYVVKSAVQKSTKETEYGPMQTIALVLTEYGKDEDIAAEWYTKATTPIPQAGTRLEGEVTQSSYGPKFKKAQAGFGAGGGFRGRSPEETRQIVRQHSQHMALLYVQAKAAVGALPADFKPSDLTKIVDWFDADALERRT